jgi:hypothetical protein
MGHVIDFNLARLKRSLSLPDQSSIREARIASLAAESTRYAPCAIMSGFLKPMMSMGRERGGHEIQASNVDAP